MLSVLSVWETAIKSQAGKLNVKEDLVSESESAGIEIIPFQIEHVQALSELPIQHGDPFDRGILATARAEGWTLFTADSTMKTYSDYVNIRSI